jgi:hypothetical protein
MDVVEKPEWNGGKDKFFESSYSEEFVFDREFKEV